MNAQGINWNDALVVGLALVAATIALVPLVILLVQRIYPGRNVYFARWGFSHVVVALAVILLSMAVVGWLWPVPEGQRLDAVDALSRTALGLGLGCASVAAFAARLAPEGIRALGLARGRHGSAVLAGVLSYFLLLPGLFGVMIVWKVILDKLAPGHEPQAVMQMMLELSPDRRLMAVFFGVLLIPLFEELLFRAFLQPLLVQNVRDRLGIVVTALIFGLLHGTAACVPVFALALLLGGLMLRTQSLIAVWAVHALHNGLMFVVIFVFPEAVRNLQSQGLVIWP
ncbi:MAG: hypothetical protein RL277_2819 [Planctomycetota bacterium]|jgi:membrane protease YdiL (CAAX protease family)